MYFKTTTRFGEILDDGSVKVKPHFLLVDAVDFIDAQTRTVQFWEPFVARGFELEVGSISKTSVLKILGDVEAESFFSFIIEFLISDDRGKEKAVKESYVIGADSIEDADEIGRRELIAEAGLGTRVVELKVTNLMAVMVDENEEEEEEEDENPYEDEEDNF